MKPNLRQLAKDLLPPVAADALRRFSPYGFSGDYATFEAAQAASSGYQSGEILQKTAERTHALIGESVQCDSRTLQLLASLLIARAEAGGEEFSVLDFGGALGGQYFLVRKHLPARLKIRWTVCDLPATAQIGREKFANAELSFADDLGALEGQRFSCVLASSSLQYTPDPVGYLRRITAFSEQLILNRLPFTASEKDRITLQRVPPEIYEASYPAWFFSEKRWLALLGELGFAVKMRWQVPEDVYFLDGARFEAQGLLAAKQR